MFKFSISKIFRTKPRLLLHICCVGCGVYVSQLLKQDYKVMLFFYNPNIWPEEEYNKRLAEAEKIAEQFNLKLIKGEYGHNKWLEAVRGHENDPERGERCLICYKFRLDQAAALARKFNCVYLTTTLTASPHKDALAVNEVGEQSAVPAGLKFLNQDFKKQDGFKKSAALSRELGLYRQNYCGCEFSQRNIFLEKKNPGRQKSLSGAGFGGQSLVTPSERKGGGDERD